MINSTANTGTITATAILQLGANVFVGVTASLVLLSRAVRPAMGTLGGSAPTKYTHYYMKIILMAGSWDLSYFMGVTKALLQQMISDQPARTSNNCD